MRLCRCGGQIKSRRKETKICGNCRNTENSKRCGKNHPRWNGGLPHCTDCGKKLSSYQSVRCKPCMGNNNLGENNPNWKNGDEKKRLRKSPQYVSWRTSVFERDDYTCRGCGIRGVYLEAHHIKGFAKYPDLRFTINNGITYCRKCHIKNDKYIGRPRKEIL